MLFSRSTITEHFVSFLNLVKFLLLTFVVIGVVDFWKLAELLLYLLEGSLWGQGESLVVVEGWGGWEVWFDVELWERFRFC